MPTWLPDWFGEASLLGLFVYSFLAATLLPGGSELVLAATIAASPERLWPALGVATIGNTLGGMTSYLCGRFLPQKPALQATRAWQLLHRHGAPALLLAWAPLLGDLLCVAAGWLRVEPWRATLYIAIGKFVRYWLIAEGVRMAAG